MSWRSTKIAKVCNQTQVCDPRSNPKRTFLYIDISAIDRTQKIITSALEALGEEAPSRARKEVLKGDILVSTVRPNLNAVAMVSPELDGQIASTGFCVLRPNPSLVEGKYLFYFTMSSDFVSNLANKVRGAHYPAVSDANVKEIDLPLPSLSEQRRIVEILAQADDLRKKHVEADKITERILPALFYKMFGDPATNPKKWPIVSIDEIVEPIERRDPSNQPDEKFVYIDISGVDGQLGSIVAVKSLLGSEAPSRARQIVQKNDIIISTVRPYLRATAIVPKQYHNQICSTGFCVLRTKEKEGHGFSFLYALSRLQWFTEQLNSRARGASYPAVIDNDILGLRIPIPIGSKIHRVFDSQVEFFLDLQIKRKQVAENLKFLFSSLLHQAFSGNLTAKWREAHMKELLAEMDEQEKMLQSFPEERVYEVKTKIIN